MLELLFVLIAGLAIVATSARVKRRTDSDLPKKTAEKLQKLWDIAQDAMRSRKFIPAEKALLTILKLDHKNAAAYNRLGILYAKQKELADAIECFEIACSINPTASSLHNLGLIYFEHEKYEKAGIAFEKALEKEQIAPRYIAYAKVQDKLDRPKKVVFALEKAVEIESNPQTLNLLIEAYESVDRPVDAARIKAKLEDVAPVKAIAPKSQSRRARLSTVARRKKL